MTTLALILISALFWIVPTTVFVILLARFDTSGPAPAPGSDDPAPELNGLQTFAMVPLFVFLLANIVGAFVVFVFLSYAARYDQSLFAAEGVRLQGTVVETETRRPVTANSPSRGHFRIEYAFDGEEHVRWFKETEAVPKGTLRSGDTIELALLPDKPGGRVVLKAELDQQLGREWRERNLNTVLIVMAVSGPMALLMMKAGSSKSDPKKAGTAGQSPPTL